MTCHFRISPRRDPPSHDILQANLEDRLRTGDYDEVQPGVFVKPGAKLGQYFVGETDEGPIVLEENVRIGPYCYLSGPVHLAAGARVIEHAAIKDSVALGHTTKVGGEVERSIVEPYTNKQHHGFLGHSYLGSWVNLGAGTSNSDLKNTYGTVAMEYNGGRVNTNMQFIGCVVGDYAKTAVNTSIFTGKTIGACTMVYGFVTTNVPSFVNYARSFGQVTEAPVDVMIATQRRMFARRSVAQRPCDIDLLYAMYDLTRHERQLATQPCRCRRESGQNRLRNFDTTEALIARLSADVLSPSRASWPKFWPVDFRRLSMATYCGWIAIFEHRAEGGDRLGPRAPRALPRRIGPARPRRSTGLWPVRLPPLHRRCRPRRRRLADVGVESCIAARTPPGPRSYRVLPRS